jgi:pimeloyl-ACP methyl ester carboxylesterase
MNNNRLRKKALLVILICVSKSILSQGVYYFTKGLYINGLHHYGREALYTDSLAYQLYSQKLQKPVAGASLEKSRGEASTWREVTADSANRFRSRSFGRGGYLYLTYQSAKEQNVLLNIQGNAAVYVNGVLHAGDPYASGWLYIPVKLKQGENEFYVRTAFQTVASIVFPATPVAISTADSTLPYVVINKQNGLLKGAVVIVNTSLQELNTYQLRSEVAGRTQVTNLPGIPALSTRKVIFNLDAGAVTNPGKQECRLTLLNNNKKVDEKTVQLDVVDSTKQYISTFISNMDGSLQYYAVTPQTGGNRNNAALFLSVHGAGVEAIGQARAYRPKDWGTLVAATNRRPRGFNWEDWGRLDALEVLEIGKEKFKPQPQHVYLTGHSMGGHGTWFLGATYPDKWAAIAPCSGYPTLKEYGSADGKIPDTSKNAAEQMLLRAGNQSDVLKLLNNYTPLGIYVLHGDSDKVVPVTYARQMKKALAPFHSDFSYYEYPGGEHWFGDQSVDWKPLFDFFKWHVRAEDSAVNEIDFTTSSPGISADYRWASVIQQVHPLAYSRIRLHRNNKTNAIWGTTENVQVLKLVLAAKGLITITLDQVKTVIYTTTTSNDTIYLSRTNGAWVVTAKPGSEQKGPARYGTFKEAFNNRMVFIYGTNGTSAENEAAFNKAKFDAESWYYRGNGAVDIIADKEFAAAKYAGRNVIIYGNATTNRAWPMLLKDCPLQVSRTVIKAGNKEWTGDDLAAYFVWPQSDGVTTVGVVAATGLKGMNAAFANQYFAGGSGFPDFMVFRLGMLSGAANGVQLVGFFNNQWKLDSGEMVVAP